MKSLCGADCANCQWNSTCPGCSDEKCFIARYIKKDGKEAYEKFKQTLIGELNGLGIPGMPKITELYALVGNFVNLEYPLPSGQLFPVFHHPIGIFPWWTAGRSGV